MGARERSKGLTESLTLGIFDAADTDERLDETKNPIMIKIRMVKKIEALQRSSLLIRIYPPNIHFKLKHSMQR